MLFKINVYSESVQKTMIFDETMPTWRALTYSELEDEVILERIKDSQKLYNMQKSLIIDDITLGIGLSPFVTPTPLFFHRSREFKTGPFENTKMKLKKLNLIY